MPSLSPANDLVTRCTDSSQEADAQHSHFPAPVSRKHCPHPGSGRLGGLSEMKLSGRRPRTRLKTMFPLWVIKSMQ